MNFDNEDGNRYLFCQSELAELRESQSEQFDAAVICLQFLCYTCTSLIKKTPVKKGSKTEIAILEFIERTQNDPNIIRNNNEIFVKYPFSSSRKRMTTVINDSDGGLILLIKGASEIITGCCTHFLDPNGNLQDIVFSLKESIDSAINQMASNALRTLCVAYKRVSRDDDFKDKDIKGVFQIEKYNLVLFAVLGIKDILREEVPRAVEVCKKAGIKVRMVTGDNKVTARAIAQECGIIEIQNQKSLVMEGTEFMEAIGGVVCKKHKEAVCDCPRDKESAKKEGKDVRVDTIANQNIFKEIYPFLDVLARSRPEDKYALVLGLSENGHIVAVTGDGTNDAPALKRADVGFAMGIAGTEVARDAADIILLDDNFTSIVKAVMWGRNIYDSIRKFLQFQLTVNVVAVFCTLIGAAVMRFEVFTPIQMLWINLIMDSLASLALATELPTEKLLDRLPHKRTDYIISKKMFKHVLGQSIYQTVVIMVLVFSGDIFLPEYVDSNDSTENLKWKYNTEIKDKLVVRSGRVFMITSTDKDYGKTYKFFPSRHFTYIFNTFVWMQIFNFINSRKIFDELNMFEGVMKNPLFLSIVFIIIVLQFFLVSFTGVAFQCYTQKEGIGGLTVEQWLICIGFSSIGLLWSIVLRFMPDTPFLQMGVKECDPIHSSSRFLDMRKMDRKTTMKKRISLLNSVKSALSNER